jgi:transcription elongation GreA/GreB family factor
MDAPLGKLLLGKRLDDEVVLELPAGAEAYLIVAIEYPAGAKT